MHIRNRQLSTCKYWRKTNVHAWNAHNSGMENGWNVCRLCSRRRNFLFLEQPFNGFVMVWESSNPATKLKKIARSVNSTEGVYFVPALVGLGSPWWKPRSKRNYYRHHTRNDQSTHSTSGTGSYRLSSRRCGQRHA